MRKLRYLIPLVVIAIVAGWGVGSAQNSIRGIEGKRKTEKVRAATHAPGETKSSGRKIVNLPKPLAAATPDTVYAALTRKRHGWYEPLSTLTEEQTRHRSMSFRL